MSSIDSVPVPEPLAKANQPNTSFIYWQEMLVFVGTLLLILADMYLYYADISRVFWALSALAGTGIYCLFLSLFFMLRRVLERSS